MSFLHFFLVLFAVWAIGLPIVVMLVKKNAPEPVCGVAIMLAILAGPAAAVLSFPIS